MRRIVLVIVALFCLAIFANALSGHFLAGGYAPYLRTSDNPILRFEMIPYAEVRYNGQRKAIPVAPFKLNSRGFRDREHSVSKVPGIFRIAGLGCTDMAGLGLAFENTKLRQLETFLLGQGRAPSYETINLGVPAYNFSQYIEIFRLMGLDYNPDMVIINMTYNDLNVSPALDEYIFSRGWLINTLFWRIPLFRFGIQFFNYDKIFNRGVDLAALSQSLDAMEAMQRASGFKLLYILSDRPEGKEWESFMRRIARENTKNIQYFFHEMEDRYVIANDWHLNAEGNRLWARLVACELSKTNGWLPDEEAARLVQQGVCDAIPPDVNQKPPEPFAGPRLHPPNHGDEFSAPE